MALLARGSILVANCGDSRAGDAIPFPEDHKVRLIASCTLSFSRMDNFELDEAWIWLERADERARVKAAGGKVRRYNDGQGRDWVACHVTGFRSVAQKHFTPELFSSSSCSLPRGKTLPCGGHLALGK